MTSRPDQGIIIRAMRIPLGRLGVGTLTRAEDFLNDTIRVLFSPLSAEISAGNPLQSIADTHWLIPRLGEALFHLMTLGYIVPRLWHQGATFKFEWFAVTERGHQWALSTEPTPEDPTGYMQTFDQLVPRADRGIRQYVNEAVLTFDRGTIFASAVMIGAASEKAVYLLADALHHALKDANEKKKLEEAMERARLPTILNCIEDNLARAEKTKAIPYKVYEGATRYLAAFQEAIRVQRNSAVHPREGNVRADAVRLVLSTFPFACRKAYHLTAWLKTHPI